MSENSTPQPFGKPDGVPSIEHASGTRTMTDQERLKLSILHLVVQNFATGLTDGLLVETCEKFHAWVTKDTLALPKINEFQALAMANAEFAEKVAARVLSRGEQGG